MFVVVVLRGRKVVLSGRRQAELNCNNLKVTEAWSVPLVLNTREKASRTRIPQPPSLTKANKFICYRGPIQSSLFSPPIPCRHLTPSCRCYRLFCRHSISGHPIAGCVFSLASIKSQSIDGQRNGTKSIFPGKSQEYNAKLGHLSSTIHN